MSWDDEQEECTECNNRLRTGRRYVIELDDDEIAVTLTGMFCSVKCAEAWLKRVANIGRYD
jgi:hypothetical protein